MPWPQILRRRAPPALVASHPNVVFLASDARYLPLAWRLARDAAAEPARNFDVVLLVLRGGGAALPPAPPGCAVAGVALPRWVRRWPVPAHMSIANYTRLFAADAWLAPWQRALYLDSDILLAGPLAPLFDLDLGGALAALSEDCGYCRRDAAGEAARAAMLRAIWLDPGHTYFNAGVILFDVALWRAADVTRQLARFKDVQAPLSGSVDQDFVNFIVRDRAVELSPRWNFQTHYLGLGLEDLMAPRVFHYLDILKPWRDPEWAQVYDPAHAAAFAARLQGQGDAAALRKRAHPDAVFAGHAARVLYERPAVRDRVVRRVAAALPRYADLTPDEKTAWARGLAAP